MCWSPRLALACVAGIGLMLLVVLVALSFGNSGDTAAPIPRPGTIGRGTKLPPGECPVMMERLARRAAASPEMPPATAVITDRQSTTSGQFTVITQVYGRVSVPELQDFLDAYSYVEGVNAVVIVWNRLDVDIPDLGRLKAGAPVRAVRMRTNSMNNRFLVAEHIDTDAVLLVDDDLRIPSEDVRSLHSVWQDNQRRLVGFLPRAYFLGGKGGSPYYSYKVHNDGSYSIILVGASMFHRRFMHVYAAPAQAAVREYVDRVFNCDDIAMNMLVARETRLPPLQVEGHVTSLMSTSHSGLSEQTDWGSQRARCLGDLMAILGGNPLLDTRLQVAPSRESAVVHAPGRTPAAGHRLGYGVDVLAGAGSRETRGVVGGTGVATWLPVPAAAPTAGDAAALQIRGAGRGPVTGVIVSFRRRANIRAIVCEASRDYGALLAEFIVVNNDVGAPMDSGELDCGAWEREGRQDGLPAPSVVSDGQGTRAGGAAGSESNGAPVLSGPSKTATAYGVPVRVIDNAENSFTLARYTGCEAARTELCFVVDDDFRPRHLRALVSAYARHPGRVVVATDVSSAHLNSRWTFFEPERRLHAGFAWLGTGALLPREQVLRFLRTMRLAGASPEMHRFADLYFTLLLNQVPLTLQTTLVQEGLDTGGAFSCSDCKDHRKQNSDHQLAALGILRRCLDAQALLTTALQPGAKPMSLDAFAQAAQSAKQSSLFADASASGTGVRGASRSASLAAEGAPTREFDCGVEESFESQDWETAPEKAVCRGDECLLLLSVDPQVAAAKNATGRQTSFPKGWAVPSQQVHFVNAVDGNMRTALKLPASVFASRNGGAQGPWVGLRRSRGMLLGGILVAGKGGMDNVRHSSLEVSADGTIFEPVATETLAQCDTGDDVCADFVRDAAAGGLSAVILRPTEPLHHAVMAARVMMAEPPGASGKDPVAAIDAGEDLQLHEIRMAPQPRSTDASRVLVVSTTPARTFGELLDCPMAELALLLAGNASVDMLHGSSQRLDGVGHRQAQHFLARHGVTLHVLPVKSAGATVEGQNGRGVQLPAVAVPQLGIMPASLRFAEWLQQQPQIYAVVHFDTHRPPVAVALRQRRAGVAHLSTAFIGHAVTSTAATTVAGARFLDSEGELSEAAVEVEAMGATDALVFPSERRASGSRVRERHPSVAVTVLRPPVYSFGKGQGRARFEPIPAPVGSGVGLGRQGVQLVVAESRHTTPQRIRDLVAACSWAARRLADERGDGSGSKASLRPRVDRLMVVGGRIVPLMRKLMGLEKVGPGFVDDPDGADDEVSVLVPEDHPLAPLVGTVDFVRSSRRVRAADVLEMLAPQHVVVVLPGEEGEEWFAQALLDAGANVVVPASYNELLREEARSACSYSTRRTQGLGELVNDAGRLARGHACVGSAIDRDVAATDYVRLTAAAQAARWDLLASAPLQLPRAPQHSYPLVSICIAHRNRGDELLLAVRSAALQSYPEIEIVVVDGESDPAEQLQFAEVEQLIDSRGDGGLLSRKWSGRSDARNFAAARAKGQLLYFLEPEAILRPKAIERMVALLLREGADAVVPWLEEFRNSDQTAVGLQEDAERWTVALTGARPPLHRIAEVFGPGPALHRRDTFMQTGGYGNEDHEGGGLDPDEGAEAAAGSALLLRLHAAGRAVVVLPEVGYTHPAEHASRGDVELLERQELTDPGVAHRRRRAAAAAASSAMGWEERLLLEYTLGRHERRSGSASRAA